MNSFFIRPFIIFSCLITLCCNAPGVKDNPVVLIKTNLGDIKIKLYNDTPVHRDNFLNLVNSGFYEGISFHRVINGFMIQAGDPVTRTVPISKIADSLNTYTVPAEFNMNHFHKKGALAAAREGNDVNPYMRSSGTHFYIVQGVKYNDIELDQAEQRINNNIKQAAFNQMIRQVGDSAIKSGKPLSDAEIQDIASLKMFRDLSTRGEYKIPADQREVYKALGGVPRLDQTYTVFGEVAEGLDVVDKIAAVITDAADKPISDVKILKMKVINR